MITLLLVLLRSKLTRKGARDFDIGGRISIQSTSEYITYGLAILVDVGIYAMGLVWLFA